MVNKKILFVSNMRLPTDKAHGYQICKVCEELSDTGAQVELWVPNRRNEIKKDIFDFYNIKRNFVIKKIGYTTDVSLERYLGKFSFYLQMSLFVLSLMFKKPNEDTIIYSRNPEIVWLFGIRGYKTFFNAHNWPSSKTWFFKRMLRKANGIVCNSQGTEKKFKEEGFKNTCHAPNGVELKDFDIVESPKEIRSKLIIPLEKKIIMYVGHFYKWKGIDVVMEVAEKMRDMKNVLFVFVGGTDNDISRYKKINKEKNINNTLFTGYKEKSLIPRYIKSADILLLPNIPSSDESNYYTSPIKMFEYMASGVPIITSSLPSIGEVLNESNSLLAEAGSADSFIQGIKKILLNSDFSKSISATAKKDVSKYTWENHAKIIFNFFN